MKAIVFLALFVLAGCTTNNYAATETVTQTVTSMPTSPAQTAERPPDMGFAYNSNARTITVVKAPEGNRGIMYAPAASDPGLGWGSNNPNCIFTEVNGNDAFDNTTPVVAGDVIQLAEDCRPDDTISLFHRGMDTLLYTARIR